jgi:hypothetical protein
MINTIVETEVLEEKMPESPWHNEKVRECEDMLREAVKSLPTAVVFRDLYFQFKGKRYAPDLAVVLQGAPPMESIGLVYRVPEDGPAPDAIIEVAVSAKSLGEALGEKVYFYAETGVKDYLVIQALPEKPIGLWFCRPNLGERPNAVDEAFLETLRVKVLVQGQKVRMLDSGGNEILPLREALERERQQWKEAEQRLIETLERERQQWKGALEQERRKREELEKRIAELERKLRGESF